MATIHPSRLGLVAPSDQQPTSERRRSRSRGQDQKGRDDRGRSNWGRRELDPAGSDSHPARPRSRSREARERRASPAYDNYERPPPSAPWRQEGSMYPPRDGGHRGGGGWSHGGGGGPDFLESRRQQRLASTLSIWPPSPKRQEREESPVRGKHKKSKRRRHDSSDSSDSSDDERARRRKEKEHEKEKKRKRHEKEKNHDRKHRDRDHDSKRSSRRHRHDSDSEGSDHDSRSKRQDKDRSQSMDRRIEDLVLDNKSKRADSKSTIEDEEDLWVEKAPAADNFVPILTAIQPEVLEDVEIGPMPVTSSSGKLTERDYGGALLRGEGEAMAAFLQDGERIPRRGEIGLTSNEIEQYETVGYVMSGSRHRRMNAVRMRKENQVISAEEKRGILKMQKEEREKRESMIVGGFKEILEERLKSTGHR